MKNLDIEFQINKRIWQNDQKVDIFQPCIQFVPIIYQFTLHTNFNDFKPNLHSWVPWRLNQTLRKTHPISSFRWRKLLSHTSSIKCFTCNYLVIYPIFSFLNRFPGSTKGDGDETSQCFALNPHSMCLVIDSKQKPQAIKTSLQCIKSAIFFFILLLVVYTQ